MKEIKLVFADVETTGLDPKTDHITEIAIITDKTYSWYINPDSFPRDYEEKVVPITGLTREFLSRNGVREEEAYNDVIRVLSDYIDKYNPSDKAFLVGYNPLFDESFLRELWLRNNDNYYGSFFYSYSLDVGDGVIKDIIEGKTFFPTDNTGKISFRLANVCRSYGIEIARAHSARADIEATRDLYYRIREGKYGKEETK